MAALSAKAALSPADGEAGPYCFLDIDVDGDREKLSRCAAFVDACDTRYGFASSDLLQLGGSELKRIPSMYELDHEWGSKGAAILSPPCMSSFPCFLSDCPSCPLLAHSREGPILTAPPACGCRVVVELFPAASPLACENFYRLCEGNEAAHGACGKPLAYAGSTVHRVQTGFVIQGGE